MNFCADMRYYDALRQIGDLMKARYIVNKSIDYWFRQKLKGHDVDDFIKRLKHIREEIEELEMQTIQYPK